MLHFFLNTGRLAPLIIAALSGFTWNGASAVVEGSDSSSIGFFERMGVEAPTFEEVENEDMGERGTSEASEAPKADVSEGDSGKSAERTENLSRRVEGIIGDTLSEEKEPAEVKSPLRTKDERYFDEAVELYNAMNHKDAITAFVKVLNYENVRPEIEKKALIYLARIYYQLNMLFRTISLMELYVDIFSDDPRREEIIFQTGKIYQELGQYDSAIAAYYRVLNAIIMAGEDGMQSYLDLARRAQFEIARTHFDLEEWAQALDLFERIALFELSEEDRETLRFYKAKSQLYLGKRLEGLRTIEAFAEYYPQSPFLVELQYEKARAQIEMKRVEAGRQTLLELVEMGGVPEMNMAEEWGEWRRFAGNFLSNFYYEIGEYETALRLYQAIVVMDKSPRWQLPIVMQMANCFRHLEQFDRAVESFEFVMQEVSSMRERSKGVALSADLDFLENSASWQLDLLKWRWGFAEQLQISLGDR
jgi:tetratricopeptide (TPR) repeat protein